MNVQTGTKDDWQMIWESLSRLTVAFQPIVNVSSGLTFGYEVLLRGYKAQGYLSAENLLRACHDSGALAEAETLVRRKAFASLPPSASDGTRTLFFNLDHRIADAWEALEDIGAEYPAPGGVRNLEFLVVCAKLAG